MAYLFGVRTLRTYSVLQTPMFVFTIFTLRAYIYRFITCELSDKVLDIVSCL